MTGLPDLSFVGAPGIRLVLLVALPFLAPIPIYASRTRPDRREAWSVAIAVVTFALAASFVPSAAAGTYHGVSVGLLAPGVPFGLRADALGVLFATLASFLWIVAAIYSIGYLRGLDEHDQTRFFAAFAASVGATLGVALAADLLTLFVFYELLTVATYPLVVHAETDDARRAGRTYLAYTLSGGVAILGGVALLYVTTGSLGFVAGGRPALASDPFVGRVVFWLLVGGFAVKTAIVPLHGWLPDAMVAPTPVSGLLHAVAVVKSGAFGIVRVVLFVFGPVAVRDLGVSLPVAIVAAGTILVAGLLALRQENLKRGLAYSTVGQLSNIVLGLVMLTPLAVLGALLHVVAHALMKITLFFCAGSIAVETGVKDVDELAGVGRRLPATMLAFAVASAGLIGFPGVMGFVTKWYLVAGTVDAGRVGFAAVFLLASLIKLLFFWPIISAAFFETDETGRFESRTPRTESAWTLLGPILVAVGVAIVLGFVPTAVPLFDLAERVVTEVGIGG